MKSREYVQSDLVVSFYYKGQYGYLSIHPIMSADANFTFSLMCDWTNDNFTLPDRNTIDTNHNTVKLFSFNGANYY
jgi:hypothetical protein